ncbi:MAG: S8 family serine peptidase [bacterium]
MRKVLLALGILLVFTIAEGWAEQTYRITKMRTQTGGEVEVVEGEILVKFKADASPMKISSVHATLGGSVVSTIPEIDFQVVKIPPDKTIPEMLALYGADPSVEYAQPNFIYHIMKTPNDPYYEHQWYLNNIGQTLPIDVTDGSNVGIPDADVDAPEAWDIQTGKSSVVVAVIDSGILSTHEDLAGITFVFPKNTITGGETLADVADDNGHGTNVTSIIASVANNNKGVAGLAYGVSIMPIKASGAGGTFTSADLAEAIAWAQTKGAHIVNMSLGGYLTPGTDDTALRTACDNAYSAGLLLVAAAGNGDAPKSVGGDDVAETGDPAVAIPASYGSVMAVAASDLSDKITSFSNYGLEIEVNAPGEWLLGAYNSGSQDYVFMSGTSQATPMVSALAALIKSQNPTWTNVQIRERIKNTTDNNLPPYNDAKYEGKIGTGRINAFRALGGNPPQPDYEHPPELEEPAEETTTEKEPETCRCGGGSSSFLGFGLMLGGLGLYRWKLRRKKL